MAARREAKSLEIEMIAALGDADTLIVTEHDQSNFLKNHATLSSRLFFALQQEWGAEFY